MRSRMASALMMRYADANHERLHGQKHAGHKLAPHVQMHQTTAVPNKLPEQFQSTVLQTSGGAFIFLPGYSIVGGSDVVG